MIASVTETSSERLKKFHAQAPEALLKCCTNDVIGLTKIISSTVNDTDPDPNKWTGYAEVEHLNSVGGIERQDLWLVFKVEWLAKPQNGLVLPGLSFLYCQQDPQKVLEQLHSK
jgi:hypothetical protein